MLALLINVLFVTGRRLRLLDANVSKAGKHGSAKAHIVVIDPDTGKKMEHIMPSSEFKKVPEPSASFIAYSNSSMSFRLWKRMDPNLERQRDISPTEKKQIGKSYAKS